MINSEHSNRYSTPTLIWPFWFYLCTVGPSSSAVAFTQHYKSLDTASLCSKLDMDTTVYNNPFMTVQTDYEGL